ncbi:papilin-like [Stegodyphus dumicola]|uniref:papilin-like n=1 Tax=Stegodyphus dumicola TaxID=202533 RepID=UPI0015AA0DEC|nr:papilin-like [Stegodyphus dumicola]
MKQMTLAVILLATSAVALSPRDPCKLPRVKGKCRDSLKRYYFHYKKSKCVKFFYSGCGGNANNFRTKQECKKTCYLGSGDPCTLPKDKGPCKARIPRWYYNGKKCKRFIYGGCGANGNNFETKKECKRACSKGKQQLPALAAKTALTPSGMKSNWASKTETGNTFYAASSLCHTSSAVLWRASLSATYDQMFSVGTDLETVKARTAIEYPMYRARPEHDVEYVVLHYLVGKWFLHPLKVMMKQMMLAVVLLATVNVSLSYITAHGPCQLARVKGKCKGFFKRYYFEYETFKCESFFYGGCGGNANNFETKEQCMKTCYPLFLAEIEDPCELLPEKGPCPSKVERYYYNGKSCEKFIYGGCGGNTNNFKTKEDCMKLCPLDPKNKKHPCLLARVQGKCRAQIPRYYFNQEIFKCLKFTYSGCGGNANSFSTKEECMSICYTFFLKKSFSFAE